MDQEFNRQQSQSSQTASAPMPPLSANKPTPKKPKAFAIAISCAVLVAVALSMLSIILVSTKADKAAQTDQLKSVDKRLKTLEDADSFASEQVDGKLDQAVFLSTGQTYFGKITDITKDTLILEDIYYLKTGTVDKSGNPTAGTDMSLVKLGSDLHAPQDRMVIERKNLSFWENLKSDGQVSKTIKSYKQQNPGQ
jgi:hypothetical protein